MAREYTAHHHGTPEYMGLGPLLNYTHVRKDDLISLGLTMLDVHGVRMPWMELPTPEDIWTSMAAVLKAWETADMEVSAVQKRVSTANQSELAMAPFFLLGNLLVIGCTVHVH